MLGMGWQEIFLVAVVAVIVVGPTELPRVLRTVSYWIRKLRGMAREFQSGVEDVIRETDLQDLRKELEDKTMSGLKEPWSDTTDLKDEVDGAMGVFENTIHAPKIEESIRDVVTVPETTDTTETSFAEETQNSEPVGTETETLSEGTDGTVDETPKRTSGLA
jgi:sec-independent protein translocase protein TatB